MEHTMKKRTKERISYILIATLAIVLGANYVMIPTKADSRAEENAFVEEPVIVAIDENNKDEQGVIYTLNETDQTAIVSGQEILDVGEIQIPDKVQKDGLQYAVIEIGNDAFEDCLMITSLVLSDTVRKFYFTALDGSSCKSIYLGAGVTTLSCINYVQTSLQKIQVAAANCYYVAENGILYDKEKTTLLKCPAKLLVTGRLTLPDSVKIIGKYAFSYGDQQYVDLSHIVEIEQGAFFHSSMMQADLRQCRKIGEHAFDYCRPQYVRFRENLEPGLQTFYTGLAAKGLFIPAGVKGIARSGLISGSLECFIVGSDVTSSAKKYSKLERVAILDGVTSMDRSIVTRNAVDKLYIPSSVTSFTTTADNLEASWNGIIYGAAGSAAETFAEELDKEFQVHEESDHQWSYGTYWENEKVCYQGDICEICGTVKNVAVYMDDETVEPEKATDSVSELDEDNKDAQGITYQLFSADEDGYPYAMAGMGNETEACHAESVTIPDFVEKDGIRYRVSVIGKYIVGEETKTIVFGEWVTNINAEAFLLCTQLETLTISANNTKYTVEDDILFNKTKTKICHFPPKKTGCYVVPSSVQTVEDYAFYDSELSDVIMPQHDVTVKDYAFAGSKITMADMTHVVSVGNYAFEKCTQLRWAAFGDPLITAGQYLFHSCVRLEAVYIPHLKKSSGMLLNNVCNGCINLRFLYMPEGMTNIHNGVIANLGKLELLYLPTSLTSVTLEGFDKDLLMIYGKSGDLTETYASEKGYKFSAFCEQKHTLTDYVICEYEGQILKVKRCEECGFLTEVQVVMKDNTPTVTPTPSPTPTTTPTTSTTSSPTPTTMPTTSTTPSPTPTATATVEPKVTPTVIPTAIPTVVPTQENTQKITVAVTPTVKTTAQSAIKKPSIKVRPVITVKKKKRSGVRYLQITLNKYKGTYIQLMVKIGKKPFQTISSKKISIRRYKGKFKIRYSKKGQKVQIKIRTYKIEKKKKVYSPYSKIKKITT